MVCPSTSSTTTLPTCTCTAQQQVPTLDFLDDLPALDVDESLLRDRLPRLPHLGTLGAGTVQHDGHSWDDAVLTPFLQQPDWSGTSEAQRPDPTGSVPPVPTRPASAQSAQTASRLPGSPRSPQQRQHQHGHFGPFIFIDPVAHDALGDDDLQLQQEQWTSAAGVVNAPCSLSRRQSARAHSLAAAGQLEQGMPSASSAQAGAAPAPAPAAGG